mmetsp:Transcript_309/g.967  ORF Transcript_309/g.967 Transcript_309/m.967 type:complete len:136 (+) Transcript_309:324-731(+)
MSATDAEDGDVTASVAVQGQVAPPGNNGVGDAYTQTVVYSVVDSDGNAADQKSRTCSCNVHEDVLCKCFASPYSPSSANRVPFASGGYYPLYFTHAQAADKSLDDDASKVVLAGKTWWMPNAPDDGGPKYLGTFA